MTLWGSDTVRDVAESVGIQTLNKDVTSALCRDVEFRMSLVLEQAIKFMRHSQRTVLWSSDIAQALRVLDVEPLYGYESTRPLRYGEASIGPGQPLFYVEDEEMDFEKLINAPLPKVPREMSFTAHWLALEGVQPTIPQNPSSTSTDNRALDSLLPKTGTAPNQTLAAMADHPASTSSTKPLVKHILSKELQLYFDKVTSSILDPAQPEYRAAGLASLREDPGLHQLLPYFVQFIAEKVTHNMRDLFTLTQMMHLVDALTRNEKLNMAPYVASIIPPVLTCLTGRNLGPGPNPAPTSAAGSNGSPLDHFELRDLAASLLKHVCNKYAKFAHGLKARLARSCLKTFLDPRRTLGAHYGAILGFGAVGGAEVVRNLVLLNLKEYEEVLRGPLSGGEGDIKKAEAEKVVSAIMRVLQILIEDDVPMMNGHASADEAAVRDQLVSKIGEVFGSRVADGPDHRLPRAILNS
ncbi:histone H4-like TAF Taf6, SAGA complex subunit [Knufia obscura]|uniref:TBP-associated factor 6 n=2 Tax=Knufia TaxID=430999 RepID=A0AAN8ETX6_9EURO|nr:histone H4-like TAF Taf6, SAGA complex subunit [Knufia obscura]KAK5953626.1 histone H4-like TAF Taf6, SAGA complex subunit [Knufia fluminis]